MVLVPKKAVLFFGQQSLKEGLPLDDASDVGFCLVGPVNWAGREAQVETMVSSVQEGCQAIADAIKGNRTMAQGTRMPQRNNEDKLNPHSSLQHQRVDARVR